MNSSAIAAPARRIAIQGVKGAFHELAARNFFGPDIELAMCDTFPDLFAVLDQEEADCAVMAIENTLAGTLLPNYALLRNSDMRVFGEVYLRIEHHLQALPGNTLDQIKEVHSHPMAIEQCRVFFKAYPHIRLVEAEDTAGSAQWIQREQIDYAAAIASSLAAEHYQLEIIARNIETHPRNFTRFLVVGNALWLEDYATPANKASLCFNLKHQVGSLSQILLVLGSHGMNLTKIQSLPVIGQEWTYFFHIDLEYDDYDQYQRSIAAIKHQVEELHILGEYPRGKKDV